MLRVGIIGGSIAGLSVANVLARLGHEVAVFERGARGFEARGGGLGLDPDLAGALRPGARPPPSLGIERRRVWTPRGETEMRASITVTAYGALWSWLREGLGAGALRQGVSARIDDAGAEGRRPRLEVGGERLTDLDLVVCAEGGDSASRGSLRVGAGRRAYAGYVLVRGVVAARHLDPAERLAERFHVASTETRHFVAYPIPGPGGESSPEARSLNWGLYVPLDDAALRDLAGAEADAPHAIDRSTAPAAAAFALAEAERGPLPRWARHLIEASTARGSIAPHPVYDYIAGALVDGRVVLAGDAAHLASPITGSGARMAMTDALALGACLREGPTLGRALRAYEALRLEPSAAVVRAGREFGARLQPPGAGAA
ncbi:MAG TPA: FAD-dependent monooxygenase [Polyangiaceae bacterium]|nr:FAD-dependent monooxygenase [Polyangiaceae bacterium]